jgi:hypothetical protein
MTIVELLIALDALSSITQNASDVRLCSQRNGYPISMEIFVAAGTYRNDDYAGPAHRCGAETTECMTEPFLFSLPPGGLTAPGSSGWTVGALRFSARPVSDGQMNGFSIRGIDGEVVTDVTYDQGGHLQTVGIKDGRRSAEVWQVCGGSFQLNDLRSLLRERSR